MRYFEYKSPDDRVLINEETFSYGSTIISKRVLNLYLVEKDLAIAICEANSAVDKSKIPSTMFIDEKGRQLDLLNPIEYLKTNYVCNSDEIIIVEHNT